VAFMALCDSIFNNPEIKENVRDKVGIDMNQVKGAPSEENLQRAFDLIEQYLYVPQMMGVDDLNGRIDKSSLMTYIKQIKDAEVQYTEGMLAKSGKDSVRAEADDLYKKGLQKLKGAGMKGSDEIVIIVENFKNKLADTDGSDCAVEELTADALDKLDPFNGTYDEGKDLFQLAKVKYGEVGDDETKAMCGECDTRCKESDSGKENLKKKLLDQLGKAAQASKDKRAYDNAEKLYSDTKDDNKKEFDDIIAKALDEIKDSKNQGQRDKTDEDADKAIDELINKMEKVGVVVDDTINDLGDVQLQEKLKPIKDEIDAYPESLRRMKEDALREAKEIAGKNDELSAEELLKIYHAFSVDLDTQSGRQLDPETGRMVHADDCGINDDINMVRLRLDRIVGQLEGLYDTENELRARVQAEVDSVFDSESLLGDHWAQEGPRHLWKGNAVGADLTITEGPFAAATASVNDFR